MTQHHSSFRRAFVRFAMLLVFTQPSALAQADEPLLHSGFEGVTIEAYGSDGQHQRIRGVDAATGGDWDRFAEHFADVYLFYLNGSRPAGEHAGAELVEDGGGPGQSLRLTVSEDAPGDRALTRAELSLFPHEEPGSVFAEEGYVSYRMKLGEDLREEPWPEHWINFFEIKEKRVQGRENYRITFYIYKRGDGAPYWSLATQDTSEDARPVEVRLDNFEVPVPIGRWFEVEACWKKHATAGRLWLAIDDQTVFDYVGRTEHETNPQPIRFWSPLKNYRAVEWLEGPREVSVLYDDVEFRRSCPGAS